MKRKLLSLVLALILVITLLPTAAQATGSTDVTVSIAGHVTGNLGTKIDEYMSVHGITSYTDITGLSVSGGTINNVDRVFLYTSGMSGKLRTVDFSGTSIDYSGAVASGHFSATNPNELPKYAFGNWSALTSIKLPDSVTNIAEWAFSNCTSLESVYLPSGLTYIDYAVFYMSSALKDFYTTSATPPTFVHPNAFMNVASGAVIHVPDGSGSTWDMKNGMADGKLYNLQVENLAPIITHTETRTSDTTAEIYLSSDEQGSIYYAVVKDGETAPAIDTSGAGEAFDASNGLTLNLTGFEPGADDVYLKAKDLLGNVTDLIKIDLEAYVQPVDVVINNHETGKLAGEIDGYLNSLGIPNRYDKIQSLKVSGGALDSSDWEVFGDYYQMAYALHITDLSGTSSQSIPDETFEFYGLTDISLPSGIDSIGAYAFYGCGNLADMTLPSAAPPTVGQGAFYGLPSAAVVHVPAGSGAAYKAVDDGDTTDDLWYGLEVVATGAPTDISTAGVTGFVAPVIGTTPQANTSLTPGTSEYTVTGLTWSPTDDPFKASTTYSATVTLTSGAGYEFPATGISAPTADGGGTVSAGTTSGSGTGNTLTFTVQFSATAALTYTATVSQIGTDTFAAQTAGYSPVTVQSITVTKTGTEDITNLAVALSGTNPSSFTLGALGATSLDSTTTSAAFTLKPNDGLARGTYTATVTVTADHGISQSFDVSFTVSAVSPNDGGGGGGSSSSGGTTVTGSVIDGNGTQVSNLTATVTTDSHGNYTVSMKAAQTVILKQPDGTMSSLSDLSKVTFATVAGSPVTVSADGTINLTNLAKGTENHFNIMYDLGNGQTITIGTMDVRVSSSREVSLTCTLIDPYGVIIDGTTGKPVVGANVTLYYANTDRNKTNGKTPDTVVPLPGINRFKPNNNLNPQISDASGAYGFMVFPTTDYYIVATKDGYNQYTSPTISVEQDIVKWDFKMTQTSSGVTRLAGLTSVDTALAIAKASYTGKVANVILATADNYPDALAGSVLAYKLNAPILLVGSSDADQEKVLAYMKDTMNPAGTVYILGGTAVVSSALEGKVTASGFQKITRLGGIDRYETSVKIADQLKVQTGTPIVLAYGENYPDALSISSMAAEMQYPILLVQKDGLSEAVKNEIAAIKPTKVYIIGGQGVISTTVESQVVQITSLDKANIVRIAGVDRYETSLAIAQYFDLSGQSVCIATGNNFPDALAGSVYAANHNAPIILADSSLSDQVMNYLKNRKLTGATLFGGEAVVSKNIEQQLGQLIGK